MFSSDEDEDSEEDGRGAAPKVALPARGFAARSRRRRGPPADYEAKRVCGGHCM